MDESQFRKKIRSILTAELPSMISLIEERRSIAENIEIGRTAFMDKMGVAPEADLYRVAAPQGPFALSKSYLELMLEGAREHKVDPKFIKWLESMWRGAK